MSLDLDANREVGSLRSRTPGSQWQNLPSQEVRLGRLVQGSHGVVPSALPVLHTEHCWSHVSVGVQVLRRRLEDYHHYPRDLVLRTFADALGSPDSIARGGNWVIACKNCTCYMVLSLGTCICRTFAKTSCGRPEETDRIVQVLGSVDNVPLVLDLVPDEVDRVVLVPGQVDNVPQVLGLVPDDADEVQPGGSLGTRPLTAGVGW